MDRALQKFLAAPRMPWKSLDEALAESERAALVAVDRWDFVVRGNDTTVTVRPVGRK